MSNVNDLTSLPSCKGYLFGPGPSSLSDTILAGLITSQSKQFLTLCNRRTFAPTTVNAIFDGTGSNIMMLTDFPLIDVASVNIDGVDIPRAPTSPPPPGVGYFFDPDGRITLIGAGFVSVGGGAGTGWGGSAGGFWFTKARKNVYITYTFGFPSIAVTDELQNVPVTSPFVVTLANSFWLTDVGVKYFIGGAALTRVFIAPNVGEYYVNPQTGQYTFNVADAGLPMLISYTYSGVPEDVQQCVNMMVGFVYGQRGSIGVSTESLGGGITTARLQKYPDYIMQTIYYYRRHFRGPSS